MSDQDDRLREAVSELANAIQVAAPLADRVRVALQQANDDALRLHGAIDRAARALRTLHPDQQEGDQR